MKPQSLVKQKFVERTVGTGVLYATDPDGNVWCTNVLGGVEGEWRFYMRADQVGEVRPSWEQMLAAAKAQQEAKDAKI